MKKFKNILNDKYLDFKQFVVDNHKLSIFTLILVASIGLYFVVFADTNSDYTLSSVDYSVTESGSETNLENGATIKNFTSLVYSVTLNTDIEIDDETENDEKIQAVVDIFIPTSYKASVNIGGENILKLEESGAEYAHGGTVYHRYTEASVSVPVKSTTFNIKMDTINNYKNDGQNFNPLIIVRKNADDTEGLSIGSSPGYTNNITFKEDLTTKFNFKVESEKKFGIKLYKPSEVEKESHVYVPVGILIYVPYDDALQLKGLQQINELEYTFKGNLNFSGESHDNYKTYLKNVGYNYTSEFADKYPVNELPVLPDESQPEVTVADTDDGIKVTLRNINIDYTNSKTQYLDEGSNQQVIPISTNVLVFDFSPSSIYQPYDYDFSATSGSVNTSISESSRHLHSINELSSSVKLSNDNYTYPSQKDASIEVNIKYKDGSLPITKSLTYIKFDDNITSLKLTAASSGLSDDSPTDLLEKAELKYYYGEWTKDYFESQPASGCSSTIDSMSKDDLINFLGTCVKAKTDKIVEKTALDDAPTDKKLLYATINVDNEFTSGYTLKYKFDNVTISSDAALDSNLLVSTSSTFTYADENSESYASKSPSLFSLFETSSFKVLPINLSASNISTYSVTKSNDEMTFEPTSTFYRDINDEIVWRISQSYSPSDANIGKIYVSVTVPKNSNYYYLNFNGAYLSKDEIDNLDSGLNSITNIIKCGESNVMGCSYETNIDATSGNIVYDFTISGDDAISAFTTSGLLFNTGISLIARGEVNISTKIKVESSGDSPLISNEVTKSATASVVGNVGNVVNSGFVKSGDYASNSEITIEKDTAYAYSLNSIINNSSDNISMVYILPRNEGYNNGDKSLNSKFDGSFTVKFNMTPSGYTFYYADKQDQIDPSMLGSITWHTWDGNTPLSNENVSAIKVVCNTPPANTPYYFGSNTEYINENAFSLTVTPSNNSYDNNYLNTFYVYANEKEYDTKVSTVKTYNRTISGIAFEDYDYDGLYEEGEQILKDLSVELYRLSKEDSVGSIDQNDYSSYSKNGELVGEAIYTTDKGYEFNKLEKGSYYIKIKYNSDKYNVTSYGIEDLSMGSKTSSSNSRFVQMEEEGEAISEIIDFVNPTNNIPNINLGLKIKESFDVSINKYIKSVKAIKSTGEENYDFDHEKQVKLDFRDLSSTSFEVTYGFDITNTKFFPGYVGIILEAIPDEMTFDSSLPENAGWTEQDGLLYYNGLADTLIMPDQTYSFEIKLTIPENVAGDFINIISVGDLRRLETATSSSSNVSLEDVLKNEDKEKENSD